MNSTEQNLIFFFTPVQKVRPQTFRVFISI